MFRKTCQEDGTGIVNSKLTKRSLLFVFFLVSQFAGEAAAQQSALVFTLAPGPYAVGFKEVNQFDHSRSFAEYSAEGTLVNEDGVRPLQTSIWYPAVKEDHAAPMLFEEYVDLVACEVGFPEMTSEVRTNARKGLQYFCDSSNERFASELKANTNAVRNAQPAKGSFPVIVYGPSFHAQSFENSVLFEYLASHGYIIVSSSSMGQKSRAMTGDLPGIESQVSDMEFLIAFAHDLPNADMEKLAVMGFSWGGISNVFLKMRNDNVMAVVCLDGSIRYNVKLFKESLYPDPANMNVPFLYLAQCSPSLEGLDGLKDHIFPNFYNTLKYSDAYMITFNLLLHENFSSNFIKLVERKLWEENENTQEEVNQSYELVCRYVLNFLNAYLKNDKQAIAFMKNKPELNGIAPHMVALQFKPAQQRPPALLEFQQALSAQGFRKASQVYADMKKASPDFSLKEGEIENWGFELGMRGRLKEALEVFKLNVELNPASSSVYTYLGEAYMNNGEKKLAIVNLEKAIMLNPQADMAGALLNKLREQK